MLLTTNLKWLKGAGAGADEKKTGAGAGQKRTGLQHCPRSCSTGKCIFAVTKKFIQMFFFLSNFLSFERIQVFNLICLIRYGTYSDADPDLSESELSDQTLTGSFYRKLPTKS